MPSVRLRETAMEVKMAEEQCSILLVDDEDTVRKVLHRKLAGKGYQCYEAANADQALYKLENNEVDLVILDIDMPGISGVELLPKIKASYPDTGIVMATTIGGTSVGIECIKLGAHEYITKPFILEEVAQIVGITLGKRKLELLKKEYQQHLEEKVEVQTKKISDLFIHAVTALAYALEAKDKYTSGHSLRVAEFSAVIAKEMGLPQASIEKIKMAGLVHDIGKIGVSESILNKPNRLTVEEYQHIQSHPKIGEHILAPVVEDSKILKLIRNHHEHYDGTGYPDHLRNTQISLGARIIAVSDAYDAMTSERPYRKAMSNKVAITELERSNGTQCDPEVVATLSCLRKRGAFTFQNNGYLGIQSLTS